MKNSFHVGTVGAPPTKEELPELSAKLRFRAKSPGMHAGRNAGRRPPAPRRAAHGCTHPAPRAACGMRAARRPAHNACKPRTGQGPCAVRCACTGGCGPAHCRRAGMRPKANATEGNSVLRVRSSSLPPPPSRESSVAHLARFDRVRLGYAWGASAAGDPQEVGHLEQIVPKSAGGGGQKSPRAPMREQPTPSHGAEPDLLLLVLLIILQICLGRS